LVKINFKSKILVLLKIFKYLLSAKYILRKPVRSKVLIFRGDGRNAIIFIDYLDWDDVQFLQQLDVEINFYILFRSLLYSQNYYQEYVDFVNPRLLLTFIDNSITFLKLKVQKESCKISIQNGYRSTLNDLYANLPKAKSADLSLDYAFCMNKYVADRLNKYIECESIVIGSFISNKSDVYFKNKNNNIAFISTFRVNYLNPEKEITASLTWGEYIRNEKKFLRWFFGYLIRTGLKLDIIGSSEVDHELEVLFYKELASGFQFNYIKRDSTRPTYELIDKAAAIVCIDSTLGYEALSRGAKVAMFSGIRGKKNQLESRQFGWPGPNSKKGAFWTNSIDQKDWKKTVEYVLKIKIDDWSIAHTNLIKDVMERDFGNDKFLTLMKKMKFKTSSTSN